MSSHPVLNKFTKLTKPLLVVPHLKNGECERLCRNLAVYTNSTLTRPKYKRDHTLYLNFGNNLFFLFWTALNCHSIAKELL